MTLQHRARRAAAAALLAFAPAACATPPRAAAAPRASRGPVHSYFHAARDSTQVWTAPSPIGSGLEVYGSFWFAGKTMTEPPSAINLVFREISHGGRWQNPRGRSLILFLDDTTNVTEDSTRYRQRVAYGADMVTVKATEWVWAPLDTARFGRIVTARTIRGTLGHTNFSLNERQLADLRALARRAAGTPSS